MQRAIIVNLAGAHRSWLLSRHIRRLKPLLVVVSEAYNADEFFNNIPGYDYFRPHRGEYDCSVGVLVRREGVNKHFHGTTQMSYMWRGPFNPKKVHKPRIYVKGRLQVAGKDRSLRYMGVHFEPSGPKGRNSLAWYDSLEAVKRRLEYFPGDPGIVLGDFNATYKELRNRIPKKWQVHQGGKVDHFITRGLKVHRTKRLAKPVGMHGWFAIWFDWSD
jgi:hypothetical protein